MPLRLLLNAHLPTTLAEALRSRGYDVIAAQADERLRKLEEPDLLAEASGQRRVIVTYNVSDFDPLAREWARREQPHWGIVLVHSRTIRQGDFRGQLRALERLLASVSTEDGLYNQTIYLASPP
ncbi:MAG: DUF5615 family PIN-like protein [Chloroflexota bacterium]